MCTDMQQAPVWSSPPLMTTSFVSGRLDKTVREVDDMCRRGVIPSVKVGRRVYVPRDLFCAKFGFIEADEYGAEVKR